ncbi:MAG: hypothetical protein K2X08_04015 [Chlamydiales bacterium]|nr:hypothetical protein [Chlamydiales bacterium]MBY0529895.1 hypothetical protein [Rhabdochlamydiaceae bacterium]
MKSHTDSDQEIENEEGSNKKTPSTKTNLPHGWTRTTIAMREEHIEKLQALAWWERALYREVLEEILEQFFSTRQIRPIPKDRKLFREE